MTDTLLVLAGMGVPPYSARGLSQDLVPIAAAASMRRTVNGALIDLSAPQFRLYSSTISGADQQPPALDGIWPGLVLTVDCIPELAYLTHTDSPTRPVVEGSEREDAGFTFYRPRLTMRVTGFKQETDEWGAAVKWSIALEEVGG